MTNPCRSVNLQAMVREISAGGVVIRQRDHAWWTAAIEPAGDSFRDAADRSEPAKRKKKLVLALPKGLVDPGEKPLETAIREVREETGITTDLVTKLGDIKYTYSRTWGDGQRVFKIVSFYLLRYRSGRIDQIDPAMRIEVAHARWVRLDDTPKLLAYSGEKQMAQRALEYVKAHPEL